MAATLTGAHGPDKTIGDPSGVAGVSCDMIKRLSPVLFGAIVVVTGCGTKTDASPAPANELKLADHPNILFEVFGEREDPRMIPLAVVDDHGKLHHIRLSDEHWKKFDKIYDHSGTVYTLYQDGGVAGTATVKQGMWEKPNAPLYSLPNCRQLLPLSAVTLDSKVKAGITVEFLATGTALPSAANPKPEVLTRDDAIKTARDVATKVGTDAGISRTLLDSLDYHGLAVNTGATSEPTLIASFIDPNSDDAGPHGAGTAFVFTIADKTGAEYAPTFSKTVNGKSSHEDFRRYVDHLDIDGDGVDELVLEGWRPGGDSYPIILKYVAGRWQEIYRGTPDWCLDQKNDDNNPFKKDPE
jgi:hypothetical protein